MYHEHLLSIDHVQKLLIWNGHGQADAQSYLAVQVFVYVTFGPIFGRESRLLQSSFLVDCRFTLSILLVLMMPLPFLLQGMTISPCVFCLLTIIFQNWSNVGPGKRSGAS